MVISRWELSRIWSKNRFLHRGMTLRFYNDDAEENGNEDNLIFEGVIHFDKKVARRFAVIDEKSYRHQSDEKGAMS